MERTAWPWGARPSTSEISGRHEPTVRLSCPAGASSSFFLRRDPPAGQAVLTGCLSAAPQRFVTVQTAFATAPASKNRSMPIVSPAPKRRPTSAMAVRQKLYLRQRQTPEVESQPAGNGDAPCATNDP